MKKKVIIGVLIIAIVTIIGCLFLFKENYTIITLDINPSLELKVDKKEKVVEVTALNDDAKVLVSNEYKNKNIDEVLMDISKKIIENVDSEGKEYIILLNIDGNISEDKVSGKIVSLFEERHIPVSVIVPKVTKEDENKAKELGITPAKAAYLSEVVKSNSDLKIENIKDKSVSELNEMKETGRYCNSGYTLDGNSCIKELRKQAATIGEVCPNGYYDYEGICYEEVPSDETNKLTCRDEFSLEGKNCVRKDIVEAEGDYTCAKGELVTNPEGLKRGINPPICVDNSKAEKPKLRCLYNPGHIMIDGKCYNGPAPLINGGCPGADKPINGGCYSKDDEDQWQCPDGNIYEKSKGTYVEYCPETLIYSNPTVTNYHCRDGFRLEGTKCVKNEIEPAEHERICKSGYTLVNYDRCINKNKTASKETGYVCDMPESRLKGNTCILYERVEAKHN